MKRWYDRICFRLLLGLACLPALAERNYSAVYFEQFAPFSQGQGSQVHGYFIDVLNEALVKRAHLPLMHLGMPWRRAQALIESGQADLMITVPTSERLAYADLLEPAIQIEQLHFYAMRSHPQLETFYRIRKVEDARPFRIGAYFGSGWVKAHMPDYKVDQARDFADSLEKLAVGRIDLVPDLHAPAWHFIREHNMSQDVVELPTVMDQLPFHVMIGKRSPLWAQRERIAAALQEMQVDGTLARMRAEHGITLQSESESGSSKPLHPYWRKN